METTNGINNMPSSSTVQLGKLQDSLAITALSYTVRYYSGRWWKGGCFRPKIRKKILNGLTINLRCGEITAILGNSGSGKTSLLDVIASRMVGSVEGSVTLGQHKLTESRFRKVAGYVIQADRLLPNLTVEETLIYTARLKFLGTKAEDDIKSKVDDVLSDMGLRHVKNTYVGGSVVRGISGGEKRRLSVAIQMLQDPDLLLLDEPTTGLDSFTSHGLIESLAELAHSRQKIILLSIHQPRSELFPMFDNIGLLCEGDLVYMGSRAEMVEYFTDQSYPCPVQANPLDFYVDVASIDRRSYEEEQNSKNRIRSLVHFYKNSHEMDMKHNILDLSSWEEPCINVGISKSRMKGKPFKQTQILLRRMTLNLFRDRGGLVVRGLTMIMYAIFMQLFVWEFAKDIASIQDRAGFIYMSVSVPPMVGVIAATTMFPSLRDVYYREGGDGLYKSAPFLIAYSVHTVPFHFLSSMGYSGWVYWSLGLYPEVDRFFKFYAVVVISMMLGELQTLLCFVSFENTQLVTSISTLLVNVGVLIGTGLLRAISTLPVPVQWVAYASYMKYTTEILVANEFDGLELDCGPDIAIPCDIIIKQWLDSFFPNAVDNMTLNFGISVAFVIVFQVLAFVSFRVKRVKHLH